MVRSLTCAWTEISCVSNVRRGDAAKLSEHVLNTGDMENQVEMEEKTRLINQVLELQHTLEGKHTLTWVHFTVNHISHTWGRSKGPQTDDLIPAGV